jgi:hypothetical protein
MKAMRNGPFDPSAGFDPAPARQMTGSDWSLPDRAFHLAEAENWPSIRRSGLHSTAVLVGLAGLRGPEAERFTLHRREGLRLPSGIYIRDQRPMPPAALARCLDEGLSPETWYALVNSKFFFWLDVDRLNRHIAACAARPQVVIAVDLRKLLARHGSRAFVTPFNVGNARRSPAARGHRSFVPLRAWLATRWDSEARPAERARPRSHPPAEIAVEGSVPDLDQLLIEAVRSAPGRSHSAVDRAELR